MAQEKSNPSRCCISNRASPSFHFERALNRNNVTPYLCNSHLTSQMLHPHAEYRRHDSSPIRRDSPMRSMACQNIGTIIFTLDSVLLVLLTAAILARFIWFLGSFSQSLCTIQQYLFSFRYVSPMGLSIAELVRVVTAPRVCLLQCPPSYHAFKNTPVPPLALDLL